MADIQKNADFSQDYSDPSLWDQPQKPTFVGRIDDHHQRVALLTLARDKYFKQYGMKIKVNALNDAEINLMSDGSYEVIVQRTGEVIELSFDKGSKDLES